MEIVVAVAIAILGTIFVAATVALVVVCAKHYCRRKNRDLLSAQSRDSRADSHLVEHMEGDAAPDATPDMEMDDVRISPRLERLLQDDSWVNDATGLAPHCLAILKTCHHLTEKLVGMTMGNSQELRNPELLTDIVHIAKRITPRVDEVVRALYPPLDPRLLEARCSSLALSVSHLVLVTKNACRLSGVLDWIDQCLADVDEHLKFLKEASAAYDSHVRGGGSPTPATHDTPGGAAAAESSLHAVQTSPQGEAAAAVSEQAPGGPDVPVRPAGPGVPVVVLTPGADPSDSPHGQQEAATHTDASDA